MRILIDTNILISAALFPQSVPAQAYMKAVMPPHDAVVCDYSMDELSRVYDRKFSQRIQDFEHFVSVLTLSVKIVPTPHIGRALPNAIRSARAYFNSSRSLTASLSQI
ncbi:MAG: PIN domain-containing protein [Coriobacteriales bacterium]|jgi:predicted nucleic acid-binding protein|nr:PIN domain-containing protein [Coriobacteriales bacterium]